MGPVSSIMIANQVTVSLARDRRVAWRQQIHMLWRISCIGRRYTRLGNGVKKVIRFAVFRNGTRFPNMGVRCGKCEDGFISLPPSSSICDGLSPFSLYSHPDQAFPLRLLAQRV